MTKQKPQRSTTEKWIVRCFLILGVLLILFEARAKYGYDMSLKYLTSATEQEEANTAVAAAAEKADEEQGAISAMDAQAQTWGSLQTEAFGALSFMAPVMRGTPGEVIKSEPIVPKNEKGEAVPLKDKDGNVIEMQAEKAFQKSLRWFSLRDLVAPEPVYQLWVKVAGEGDAAEIVTYRSAGMSESDLWANPDRLEANPYIPQSEASKYLGGGGGGGGGGRQRRQRPDNNEDKADNSDQSEDAGSEEAGEEMENDEEAGDKEESTEEADADKSDSDDGGAEDQ